ncbi:MAG: homocysteine S-methyltransferase family protein [Planctomycetes bacterium]|nr:homocysteine S-methyltransferase family protein [Planctomycetota bacterium]
MPEILLALAAVKSVTNLPVVASMSFDSGPQRARTLMGATAEQAAAALDEAGADAIGSNCGAGIAAALPAVVALRANTKKPLWIKPSVGLPDLEEGRPVYHHTPDEFGGFVPALIDAGANILGGCCGAGPEHIRRVAALVASRRRKH